MNTSEITISFSIQYQTIYGEELYVSLDDSSYRKLTWKAGHIWVGNVTIQRPRTLRWSYSVQYNGVVVRHEQLLYPRQFKFDANHKFFHVFDRWDCTQSSVSPLTITKPQKIETTNSEVVNKGQTYSRKRSPKILSVFVRVPQRVLVYN
ncbi:hypothetical protein EIN_281720 [Entamoeba invadens IP1]|uniref:Uncharacterized protein n=1 Tax=Entamoeba invadens IP1 TaxID=370355 RepID=A0A0A1U007_ENTIV|nr:hypothetical protein EIN_281720 [Entamoeba invadens IP1]ELP85801.1 hypothetical protein EIN_281720 [Entamoeba invadens IP1]|eukprot:XP_004185147.1 hypothetical protein EIN_281720 [Entamoeba invadens IP1]